MKIGIIGAMAQEVAILKSHLNNIKEQQIASCTLYTGEIAGHKISLIQSGIGKSASAMATTALLIQSQPDLIINTGSAGGIVSDLNVGDIILSTATAYHDADVTAFGYAKGQLPNCPAQFEADEKLIALAEQVIQLQQKNAVKGLICSGDLFCNSDAQIAQIKHDFPNAIAVEMEAASIAQICHAFQCPFVVVRAVSDVADKASHLSFEAFLPLAAQTSSEIVLGMLAKLA